MDACAREPTTGSDDFAAASGRVKGTRRIKRFKQPCALTTGYFRALAARQFFLGAQCVAVRPGIHQKKLWYCLAWNYHFEEPEQLEGHDIDTSNFGFTAMSETEISNTYRLIEHRHRTPTTSRQMLLHPPHVITVAEPHVAEGYAFLISAGQLLHSPSPVSTFQVSSEQKQNMQPPKCSILRAGGDLLSALFQKGAIHALP